MFSIIFWFAFLFVLLLLCSEKHRENKVPNPIKGTRESSRNKKFFSFFLFLNHSNPTCCKNPRPFPFRFPRRKPLFLLLETLLQLLARSNSSTTQTRFPRELRTGLHRHSPVRKTETARMIPVALPRSMFCALRSTS